MSQSISSHVKTQRSALRPTKYAALIALVTQANTILSRVPYALVAVVARFSIAAVFWTSGQTKITGFALNLVSGEFALGWPRLSDTAVMLFQEEYKLPLLAPQIGAVVAAVAEHVFPVMLLIGLGTRYAALALLGMTLVIQIFVYPGAYATHGTWAALLLLLISRGAGVLSVDHWLAGSALTSHHPAG